MAANLVQQASNTSASSSCTVTLGQAQTLGNLMVAVVVSNVSSASTTVATYTSAVNVEANVGSGTVKILYARASNSTTTTVVCNATGGTMINMHVYEFAGFGTTTNTALDKTASTIDGGSAVTSRDSGTTAATTLADEIVVAGVGTLSSNGGVVSWSNSFTTGVTTDKLMSSYAFPFVTGAQSTTCTYTSSVKSAGAIATFFARTGNTYSRGGR